MNGKNDQLALSQSRRKTKLCRHYNTQTDMKYRYIVQLYIVHTSKGGNSNKRKVVPYEEIDEKERKKKKKETTSTLNPHFTTSWANEWWSAWGGLDTVSQVHIPKIRIRC